MADSSDRRETSINLRGSDEEYNRRFPPDRPIFSCLPDVDREKVIKQALVKEYKQVKKEIKQLKARKSTLVKELRELSSKEKS